MVAENSLGENVAQGQRNTLKGSSDEFIYFAYGSNLLKERIHVQVKGAVFISNGVLNDHELVFYDTSKRWQGAVASIEGKESSKVWGCIWRVPNSFAEELDIQERGYHRLQIDVFVPSLDSTNPMVIKCRTYQYSNERRVLSCPSPHYKRVIVAGAIEHCLPSEYIELLDKIPTNGYRGKVELKLKAIKNLNEDEYGNEDSEIEGGCDGA